MMVPMKTAWPPMRRDKEAALEESGDGRILRPYQQELK